MTAKDKATLQALNIEIRESSGRVTLLKFDLNRMVKALQIAARTITGLTHGFAPESDLAIVMTKIPSAQKIIDVCVALSAERARAKELKASAAALGL